jgi:hypothetical protein
MPKKFAILLVGDNQFGAVRMREHFKWCGTRFGILGENLTRDILNERRFKMRIILMTILAVFLNIGQSMAKDDGGFGSSRFSSQAPVALGGAVAPSNQIAVVPPTSPADIEPAAGEEDITPEEETLDKGQVIQNSEPQSETTIIQKDLSVRLGLT